MISQMVLEVDVPQEPDSSDFHSFFCKSYHDKIHVFSQNQYSVNNLTANAGVTLSYLKAFYDFVNFAFKT